MAGATPDRANIILLGISQWNVVAHGEVGEILRGSGIKPGENGPKDAEVQPLIEEGKLEPVVGVVTRPL
jgi:hypothetical protein